jgi:hypothetical protein
MIVKCLVMTHPNVPIDPANYAGGYPGPVSPIRRRRNGPPWWLIAGLAGIVVMVLSCLIVGLLAPVPKEAPRAPVLKVPVSVVPVTEVPQVPASVEPTETLPTEAAREPAGILGDDLVLIGQDVPAGTYRVIERVTASPWCYWAIYRDSNLEDIVSNDIVTAGRPQVVLKKGQWFKSNGCPDWRKNERAVR